MGTKNLLSKYARDLLPQLVCSSNFIPDCECGKKRALNSTNDDQVFLHTKVCPHQITQVVFRKVVRASEGELQTKAQT